MNKVKDSLKNNLEEILANLPSELHADFKKQVEEMPTTASTRLSPEDEVKAIKAELVANESVDENAAAAELKEIQPIAQIVHETEAEIAAHMAERLAEMQK